MCFSFGWGVGVVKGMKPLGHGKTGAGKRDRGSTTEIVPANIYQYMSSLDLVSWPLIG